MFTVKNVRSFQGRQGIGYICDLYRNNEKVATVEDYADGGYPYGITNYASELREYGKTIGLPYSEELIINCIVDSVENHVSIETMVAEYKKFLGELI
jgi:hypothetical protein